MAEPLARVRRWWRIRNAHHFEIRYREPGKRGWRPIDTVVSFSPREFSVAADREAYVDLAEQEAWPPGHYEVRAYEGTAGHQFGPQIHGWDVRLDEWEGDDQPENHLDVDDDQDGDQDDDGEEVEPPSVDDQDDVDGDRDDEENDAVITAEDLRWIDEHFPNFFS